MFDSCDLPPVLPDSPEWLQERIEYAIRRLYHLKKSLQAEPSPALKPYSYRPQHSDRLGYGQRLPSWNQQ